MSPSEPDTTPVTAAEAEAVAHLLELARAGSVDALGRLLEECRAYLLAVANAEVDSVLRPKGGASDMVQEAFLEAQRVFGRFHGGGRDELLAWLRAILLNKVHTFSRRYHGTGRRDVRREIPIAASDSTPPSGVADSDVSPSEAARDREQLDAVRAAVERLPPEYRQIIAWRQWDELPFDEIARRLGKSVDAARMTWWRAFRQLERDLGDRI